MRMRGTLPSGKNVFSLFDGDDSLHVSYYACCVLFHIQLSIWLLVNGKRRGLCKDNITICICCFLY